MEHIRAYIAAPNLAMDILAEAADASAADLNAAGMPDAEAESISQLAQVYFGPTRFRRRQRRAVDGARRNRHSLPTLEVIEKHARCAPTQARAWALRAELTHIACDTREMERRARAKLRKIRAPREPKPGVRLRRRAAGKPWTLSVTGPSALIAELHQRAGSLADVASFFRTGASTSTVRTNVVVPLDKLVGVAHGSDDVVLTMTNGAQITGAELAQRSLAEEGFVTLLHPVEGPVNLYRMRRGATWKQFMMAAAENPVRSRDAVSPPMSARSTTSSAGPAEDGPMRKTSPPPVPITMAAMMTIAPARRAMAASSAPPAGCAGSTPGIRPHPTS